MKKKKSNYGRVSYEDKFNGKTIFTDKEKGWGCREDILEKIDQRIEHATEKRSKTLCTRMDFRFPRNSHPPKDNSRMTKFLSTYNKDLKRSGDDPQYVCVREQSREKHQHYHLMLLTNQRNHQSPHSFIEKAEKHWAAANGLDNAKGLVDHCTKSRKGEKQPNSYRLNRNDDNFEGVKDKCFKRCSYLAKVNTKGKKPKFKREVLCSRLPKNQK